MRFDPPELAAVIFDLDGTLADTIPVAFDSFRVAVSGFVARPFSDTELRSFFGPSEDGILQRIVPDDWAACFELYLREYDARHDACSEPFPGVYEMLDLLDEKQIRVGLVTGKVSNAVAITLNRLGLANRFHAVESGSPAGDVKAESLQRVVAAWGIKPSRAAYVGDTPADMAAAVSAGLLPVGAAWVSGAHADGLARAGAHVVFESVDDLTVWLRGTLRTSLSA